MLFYDTRYPVSEQYSEFKRWFHLENCDNCARSEVKNKAKKLKKN